MSRVVGIKYDNPKLIATGLEILKLVKESPYSKMLPEKRYLELFPLYQDFAIAHPVVFKTIVHDFKFNKAAFNKYMRIYTTSQINPENHAKLGANYLMFIEEATLVHPSRQQLCRYRQDCLETMQKDLEKVQSIEKEEREKYKKREEERLEENKQELFEYFKKLHDERAASSS